ncbi:MAG: hypothetical protein L6R40_000794 [Gallowayella cf. fulva]|nr:MAG: hypothetical protein L6R40_000794 [Xanthomendoza cf. fulva]
MLTIDIFELYLVRRETNACGDRLAVIVGNPEPPAWCPRIFTLVEIYRCGTVYFSQEDVICFSVPFFFCRPAAKPLAIDMKLLHRLSHHLFALGQYVFNISERLLTIHISKNDLITSGASSVGNLLAPVGRVPDPILSVL